MRRTPLLPVGLFTGLYLAIAIVFAVLHGNVEFLFYIGVVVLIGIVTIIVHRRVNLSQGVLFALSLWGLLHMLGGLLPVPADLTEGGSGVLYSWWIVPGRLKYDNIVHAYGFAVASWACWQCIRTVKGVRPTVGILTLCALGGMGLGAANEIVEFVAVLLIPETNVGGYINTGWDLVANLIGATVAATLIGSYHRLRAR